MNVKNIILEVMQEIADNHDRAEVQALNYELKDIDTRAKLYDREMQSLKKKEAEAFKTEDFNLFQNLRKDYLKAIDKLIKVQQEKVETLGKLKMANSQELEETSVSGDFIFKKKELTMFNNETFKPGDVLMIKSAKNFLKMRKTGKHGDYTAIESNIQGVQAGDTMYMTKEFKKGNRIQIKFSSIAGQEKNLELTVITIVKNP